jgi:hypothetical protein
MSIELLKESYVNAKTLIEFTKEVRGKDNSCYGKYSINSQKIQKLFNSKVWVSLNDKGGHIKKQHAITKTIIEYKNHDNKNGIDPGAVMTILDTVQTVLNVLGNDVFKYKLRNWKTEPNYEAALKRLIHL